MFRSDHPTRRTGWGRKEVKDHISLLNQPLYHPYSSTVMFSFSVMRRLVATQDCTRMRGWIELTLESMTHNTED